MSCQCQLPIKLRESLRSGVGPTGDIEYGPPEVSPWIDLTRHDWFGDDIGLGTPNSSLTDGDPPIREDNQARYAISGYTHLAVAIYLQFRQVSDDTLGDLTVVTLGAGTTESDWVSAPAATMDDGWYCASVSVRVLPYTTGTVPLP